MPTERDISMNVALLIHIYYEDTYESIYERIEHFSLNENNVFLINICRDNFYYKEIESYFKSRLKNAHIISCSNKGKDIGGKLALIDLYIRLNLNADLMLLIHDKKSPQLIEGNDWQEELLYIIQEDKVNDILKCFEDSNVGMVGNKSHIINKSNNTEDKIFAGGKDKILSEALKYNINPDNYSFIGGTMFWVRSKTYIDFFQQNNPLKIRATLEERNVMDDFGPTITHSWERLLGWIVLSAGQKIIGI